MSTSIAETNGSKLTPEMIATLEQAGIVPKNTPEGQIKVFAQVCADKGLSPFSKEIYLVGYAGKYSVITGIDGFRKLADRTGALAGCSDAKFDLQPTGQFHTAATLHTAGRMPTTCTVTVQKMVGSTLCDFTHTAVFKEFSSGQQKWATMPFQMINKVAEAFALRKAFAANLSGIHIEEEAAAIQGITETQVVAPAPEIHEDVTNLIAAISTIQDLNDAWNNNKEQWVTNKAIVQLVSARKAELLRII